MRHFTALLILMIISAITALAQQPATPPANGYTLASRMWPGEQGQLIRICAIQTIYPLTTGGVPIQQPLPNAGLTAKANVSPESGYHTNHSGNRPQGQFLGGNNFTASDGGVAQRLVTGGDGCANWVYTQFFSGWTSIIIIPDDPSIINPGMKWNFYVGSQDIDANGNKKDFRHYDWDNIVQPLSLHNDNRHQDQFGASGYSRYGTDLSVSSMENLALVFLNYETRAGAHGTQLLDIIRGRLPHGGHSDNEQTYTSQYISVEWDSRYAEQHMADEWDVVNPALATGDVQDFLALNLQSGVLGCRLGLVTQNGAQIQQVDGSQGYWASQQVIHMTCAVNGVDNIH